MKHTPFRFKQFTIHHDRSTMKVGTDGVLLGAWANINAAQSILDIGTGSGLIALMLAQRSTSSVKIDAVELEAHASHEATENVKHSPWSEKITVHHTAIQQFESALKYDMIISNPPYFENSQKPPEAKRAITRHTDTLSFEDLLRETVRLLNKKGKLNVILPYKEGLNFIERASQYQLTCNRQWTFHTRKEKPIERLLLEFSYHSKPIETGDIVLYEEEENWSAEYKELTKEFYLKL
ncbi:MAG TPA: methyltransferase [Cyclobacteriaceae bacterium]